jgi:hypothetical protein
MEKKVSEAKIADKIMEDAKRIMRNSAELRRVCEPYISSVSSDASDKIGRTIFEFNRKLRNNSSRDEAYAWLEKQKDEILSKYGLAHSYSFLYPELLGDIPETYEEWRNQIKGHCIDGATVSEVPTGE